MKSLDPLSKIPEGVDCEAWLEAFEERAAIMQYDGELTQKEAEQQAFALCLESFTSQ